MNNSATKTSSHRSFPASYHEVLSLKNKAKSNWLKIEGYVLRCSDLNQANEIRIASIQTEIENLEKENSGFPRIMARFEDQEEASMSAINENKDKIKRLKTQRWITKPSTYNSL